MTYPVQTAFRPLLAVLLIVVAIGCSSSNGSGSGGAGGTASGGAAGSSVGGAAGHGQGGSVEGGANGGGGAAGGTAGAANGGGGATGGAAGGGGIGGAGGTTAAGGTFGAPGGAGGFFMACLSPSDYVSGTTTILYGGPNYSYTPACLKLAVGATATFSPAADGDTFSLHPLTPADYGTKPSPIVTPAGGTTATFTFSTPGLYPFYCGNHGFPNGVGMAGVIWVE